MDHYMQDFVMKELGSILYEYMGHYHQGLSLDNEYPRYHQGMLNDVMIDILSMLLICQYARNNHGDGHHGQMIQMNILHAYY
jgi:hypothetical protein